MADVLEKPDKRFYDIDKEQYNNALAEEFKKFRKQLDGDMEVEVEPQQTVTVVFDTRVKK